MVEHGSTPFLQSVRELADWPAALVQTMQQNPKMLFRLEQAVGHGVVGHTDFSGRRCSESALNMSFVALLTAGCQVPDTIRWHRSSDIAEHCQQIALETQHPPDHVFGSLQSRVSKNIFVRWKGCGLRRQRHRPGRLLRMRSSGSTSKVTCMTCVALQAHASNQSAEPEDMLARSCSRARDATQLVSCHCCWGDPCVHRGVHSVSTKD